jgi:dephospho-CoA kinase
LIEAGWTSLVDEVWLVTASRETVSLRLQERNGLSDEAISARVAAQLTDEERTSHADQVIQNNGSLEELTATVEALWAERIIEAKVRNNDAT